uniref:Uncharacterized protein n=1 Tax=Tetranychus urticae TaxID=32264 RepID=T1L3L9_TETUR
MAPLKSYLLLLTSLVYFINSLRKLKYFN